MHIEKTFDTTEQGSYCSSQK